MRVKPNIYPKMSWKDYLEIRMDWNGKMVAPANYSTLKNGARTCAHFRVEPKETDALFLGRLTHYAVFEPSKLRIWVSEFDGRTKKGKAERAEAEKNKLMRVKPEEHKLLYGMRDAVQASWMRKEFLDATGDNEVTVCWYDKETGFPCKGRIDRFCSWRGWPTVLDLKTAQSATPFAFRKAVTNYKYHVQAAFYLDGLSAIAEGDRRWLWIVPEKARPYAVACYEPDDDMLSAGRAYYRVMLKRYMKCVEDGEWPGYPAGPEPLSLPNWYASVETEELGDDL